MVVMAAGSSSLTSYKLSNNSEKCWQEVPGEKLTGLVWARGLLWGTSMSPMLNGFSREVQWKGKSCWPRETNTCPTSVLCCGVLANHVGPGTSCPGANLAATTYQLADSLGLSVPHIFLLSNINGSGAYLGGYHEGCGSMQSPQQRLAHRKLFSYLCFLLRFL